MAETTNYKLKKVAGNEIADISFVNENMDKIDAALKNVEDAADGSGNASIITATNTSVPVSAWASDTTYTDFPFRAGITIPGCTADHKPDITFCVADAMNGNYAPVAESYAGGVYIYAVQKPAETVTIPTITLLKKKEASA